MGGPREGVVFASRHAALLRCPLCFSVFTNPVVTSCGHTWCEGCMMEYTSAEPEGTHCPLDNEVIDTSRSIVNKLVAAQVSQLLVHCKHGLKWSESQRAYIADSKGCPATMPLSAKEDHESVCTYNKGSEEEGASTPTPDGDEEVSENKVDDDPSVVRACVHSAFGCGFAGDQSALEGHLTNDCGYERLKIAQDMMLNLYRSEVAEKEEELEALQLQAIEDNKPPAMERLRESFKRIEEKIDARIDGVILTVPVQAAGLAMYKTRQRIARSAAVQKMKAAMACLGAKTKKASKEFSQSFEDAFSKMSHHAPEPLYVAQEALDNPSQETRDEIVTVPDQMQSSFEHHNPEPCDVLPPGPYAHPVVIAGEESATVSETPVTEQTSDIAPESQPTNEDTTTTVKEQEEHTEETPTVATQASTTPLADTEVADNDERETGQDWEFLEAAEEVPGEVNNTSE